MIEDTAPPTGLFTDDHQVTRCVWCRATPEYQHYHDHEWGFPVQDDRRLFEKVCLEGFQAGLSWLTILKKREAFRRGFANFDMDQVAGFGEFETKRLLLDAGIVRHQGKIASTINNAQRAQELRKEFGSLAAYFWRFEPATDTRPQQITRQTMSGVTTSPESIALSKDLRKRGWSFVGPTTMYALMVSAPATTVDQCAVSPTKSVTRRFQGSSASMASTLLAEGKSRSTRRSQV